MIAVLIYFLLVLNKEEKLPLLSSLNCVKGKSRRASTQYPLPKIWLSNKGVQSYVVMAARIREKKGRRERGYSSALSVSLLLFKWIGYRFVRAVYWCDLKTLALDFILPLQFIFMSTCSMQNPVTESFGDSNVHYIPTVISRSMKMLRRVIMYISKCHDNSKQGQVIYGGRNLEWFHEGREI